MSSRRSTSHMHLKRLCGCRTTIYGIYITLDSHFI
nr:MAG TPA: hypothetical protein [Caudoviricetes sp.]